MKNMPCILNNEFTFYFNNVSNIKTVTSNIHNSYY